MISFQSPVTIPQLPFDIWVKGFDAACERFYAGVARDERGAASIPLFEALHWGVAIDNQLQARWRAAPTNGERYWMEGFMHGDVVKGVRWARNAVHHDWIAAMYTTRCGLPASTPPDQFEWCWMWKLTDDPEKPGALELAEAYYWKLGGRPVRETLGELSMCFADAVPVLTADQAR